MCICSTTCKLPASAVMQQAVERWLCGNPESIDVWRNAMGMARHSLRFSLLGSTTDRRGSAKGCFGLCLADYLPVGSRSSQPLCLAVYLPATHVDNERRRHGALPTPSLGASAINASAINASHGQKCIACNESCGRRHPGCSFSACI